jgi:N-methylhydantoinase A
MRLFGQAHQISVPIPAGTLAATDPGRILAAFEETYRALYRRTAPGVAVEAMTWRVNVSGPQPPLTLRRPDHAAESGHTLGSALKGERPVYFPEFGGFHPTPVYDRYRLRPGDRFAGPAVAEERESTALVGPGATATVDAYLNLVIQLPAPAPATR